MNDSQLLKEIKFLLYFFHILTSITLEMGKATDLQIRILSGNTYILHVLTGADDLQV